MDVGRFLAVLKSRSLYFARPHELDDKWEALQLPRIKRELLDWSYLFEKKRQERHGTLKEDSELRSTAEAIAGSEALLWDHSTRQALVNCWHRNDSESIAMWNLYTTGAEGVAIESSLGHLRDALKGSGYSFSICQVRYDDHERSAEDLSLRGAGGFTNPIQSVLSKRKIFSHEREIRVVINYLLNSSTGAHGTKAGQALEVRVDFANKEPGQQISVDLDVLVKRIVVSPAYPTWAVAALQDTVNLANLHITIDKSSVHETPIAD